MRQKQLSRRKAIKDTLGAGILLTGSKMVRAYDRLGDAAATSSHNSKGLPTAILGKTGVRIPRMAIGLGSRFCNIEKEEDALGLLHHALDNGLYYWDTSTDYVNEKFGFTSEGRIGEILKTRRKEVFICTKVDSRDPDQAKRQIETSLKRLQTDHIDLLKIHSVDSLEDVAKISKKGNLIDIVHDMKNQGIARFIGFSGHANADALKAMVDRAELDTILMALNHYKESENPQERQSLVLPAAKAKNMGVMVMKTVRPRETVKGLDPSDLIRYALSLNGPDGIVVGMESQHVMDANLDLLRSFAPLNQDQMKQLALTLTPFYRHEDLPWMMDGYHDGRWV